MQDPSGLKDLAAYGALRFPGLRSAINFGYKERFYSINCRLRQPRLRDLCPRSYIHCYCRLPPHQSGLVDIPEKYVNEEAKGVVMKEDKEVHPNFSTSYLRFPSQVLGQWQWKIERRGSVFEHPPRPVSEGNNWDLSGCQLYVLSCYSGEEMCDRQNLSFHHRGDI
jgi:hypothetical protein